jgi:signal transduction histidine kinase
MNEEEKAMRRMVMSMVVVLSLFGAAGAGMAAEKRGTAAEAEAMVKKAVAYMKSNGTAAAFAEISNPKGRFTDRDLYVFVYDMNGKCVAHGQNAKMIGKELGEMKDADGKLFVKERIEIAKAKGKGWQDYKFTDPLTKKIERKSAYVERYEDLIVGSGIYR